MSKTTAWLFIAVISGLPGCSDDEGSGCRVDADCPSGRYCRLSTGECTYDCTFDSDCPGELQCTARGRCGCAPTNGGQERCDSVDNDCDGDTDEDLTGEACSRENQLGRCEGVERCQNGSYSCDASEPAPEDCDQVDNDCDGEIDENLNSVICPLSQGVCADALRSCLGQQGWSDCDYGPEYEEVEQSCDLLDNDCDGNSDEELGGETCLQENEFGSCQGFQECREGELFCTALIPAEDTCDQIDNDCDGLTDEGAAPTADCEIGEQATDSIDNNCDGLTDEPGGCMVRITQGQVDVFIDVFENAVYVNQDCTGVRYGINNDYPGTWPPWEDPQAITLYACSVAGVKPSAFMSLYRARRACQAQGKRLCTKAEWSTACGGPSLLPVTYGPKWLPDICNDFSLGADDVEEAGSQAGCLSPFGTYDMSGNVWEFVEDICRWDPTRISMQGGSYGCDYCDPQDNCVPCDESIPAHLEEIESRYGCHYPGDDAWCGDPELASKHFGFRCCLDP